MVKWLRIFGDQYLGFWVLGLLLFFMQEIPYMIMPLLKLETNPIMNMPEASAALNVCEKVLSIACIALMTFVVCNNKSAFSVSNPRELLFLCISLGVLLLNYFGWFLYFTGHQSMFVMIFFLVAMPPLFYVFVGLWRNNVLLTVTGCVFLVVHFMHVLGNLKMGIS